MFWSRNALYTNNSSFDLFHNEVYVKFSILCHFCWIGLFTMFMAPLLSQRGFIGSSVGKVISFMFFFIQFHLTNAMDHGSIFNFRTTMRNLLSSVPKCRCNTLLWTFYQVNIFIVKFTCQKLYLVWKIFLLIFIVYICTQTVPCSDILPNLNFC